MKLITIALFVTLVTLFAAEPQKEEVDVKCTITTETVVEEKVESDAVEGCMYSGPGYSLTVCAVMGCDHRPPVPATWRKEITITKIVRTLTFEWRGKTWTAKDEEEISREEKRFVLKETWEESDEKSAEVTD